MTSKTCPRCGGFGSVIFPQNEHVSCPTCGGLGRIKIYSEYVQGSTDDLVFGSGENQTNYNLDDLFACDVDSVLSVWHEFVSHVLEIHGPTAEIDWWLVHEYYPAVAELEEWLFDNRAISLTEIPGGPHRPEVKSMSSEGYKPYRAYKDKVAAKRQSVFEEVREETTPDAPVVEYVEQYTIEEVAMPSKTTDKLKDGGLKVAEAMKRGAIQGAIGGTNRQVVTMIEQKLGEKYPEIFKTEIGRKAVETMIPSLVLMACAFDVNNRIPQKDHIERAAEYAVTDASADAVGQVIEMLVTEAFPILSAYASAGHMLEEQQDFSDILNEEVPERELVHATTDAVELLANA